MLDGMTDYQIRRGYENEDESIAQNFYEMWMDIGMTPDSIEENWKQIILDRIQDHRKTLSLSTIVIVNDRDEIVGSCVCQIYNTNSLHPDIIKRSTYQCGYLWGVFIKPEHRNKGLGKKMMKFCTEYFKEIGCSEAKLWASEKGKPIYKHEGYEFVNSGIQEMVLALKK